MTFGQIQHAVLLFWGIWFSIVTLTNLSDGLLAAGMLPSDWRFASGNYAQIKAVTSRYSTPPWLLPPLFAGVIAWEALASALFVRAWVAWRSAGDRGRAAARLAYAVAIALWAAFLMVDEFFIAYEVAATHLGLFTAHMVCLGALALPGHPEKRDDHPIT